MAHGIEGGGAAIEPAPPIGASIRETRLELREWGRSGRVLTHPLPRPKERPDRTTDRKEPLGS